MKRAVSLILSLALALALLPAQARAASPAYGSDVWLRDTALQNGVTYSENIFWSSGYEKPRHEYVFTYTPGVGSDLPSAAQPQYPSNNQPYDPTGDVPDDLSWLFPNGVPGKEDEPEDVPEGTFGDPSEDVSDGGMEPGVYTGVRPVASYGSSVCGRSTVSDAAKKYESMGYRVVGGINGDFYDTATGYPLGILISDGELLSGSSEYYAVGFYPDGSAVMGSPKLSIVASSYSGSVKLASLNKPRVENAGVTMLTCDYRDDHTTGSSVASDGVNVLATIIGGRASIGESLLLQVTEVAEDAQTRTLAEGQVLLTGSAGGYTEGLAFLRALTPGELVTVSFSTPDTRWNGVTEAIGAYYSLVENGVAKEDFEVSAAPRTAVGVKANGEVVFYALDGRQNAVSMGASLGVLAKRMAELGCVTALCLDGGGSTTAVAATPDSASAKLLNSPSDKSQRKVTNHLMLLAPGDATGMPGGVHLSVSAPVVLTGHSLKLSANVTDTHYFPMELPVEFYASAGTVQDGTFTAPDFAGTASITAAYDQWTTQRDVLVVDTPSTMSILASGSTAVNVMAGGTAQLSVSAAYNHTDLEIGPADVTWSVDPKLGAIDENGLFTASAQAGSGVITAARGTIKASIPVTVESSHPFADLSGHWAEAYMGELYQQKILNGELAEDGQLYAYPERGLTRAEFSVLLAKYLKLDTAAYEGQPTVFTDLTGVESWAGAAIRAMYENGIVHGVDETRFAPQAPLERAQAAAMLGRALGLTEETGVPEENMPPLPEVPGDDTAPAGTPDENGPFDPTGVVSGSPEEDGDPIQTPEPPDPVLPDDILSAVQPLDLSGYPDADKIPEYALTYFCILVEEGALSGRDGLLEPSSPITRAEICQALVVMQNNY